MKNNNILFFLNGKKYQSSNKITIENLLKYFNYKRSLLIVEHNHFIVYKEDWTKYTVQNLDKIEIISIVGGG